MANNDQNDIENRLWSAADKLWANTGLKPSEYAAPILGLIFLRYAETRFTEAEAQLGKAHRAAARSARRITRRLA